MSGGEDLLDGVRLAVAGAAVGLRVEVVAETGSTNADVAVRARAGEAAGLVVAAERQRAGRGRLDRTWESPAGRGLTVSLLARPATGAWPNPASMLGWVPMVAGTALVGTLRSRYGVPAWLKWPNDVQADGAKLAGILVELVPSPPGPPGLVIGFGLNVHTAAADLPPGATSLAVLAGAGIGSWGTGGALVASRTELLASLLTDLARALTAFEQDPGAARPAYRAVCATLGRDVRVELPGGESVVGVAGDVDGSGRLVVNGRAFSAADVVHLRPAATGAGMTAPARTEP
ncbi:biotin--[acetyl-CoA-carboxylase] ligase [Pseudofrankia sp. DC12]|uniref:biotin--[acetyl-CoA-carboxylase] ligase n=1 Tax=Pseudofrankia sp. DC12 TaxID=683315 RepID=UPI001E533D1E|nr:biotin--[acetyl-CoA-carboxylase] ligase [Pseudofrankia sp. DC12]